MLLQRHKTQHLLYICLMDMRETRKTSAKFETGYHSYFWVRKILRFKKTQINLHILNYLKTYIYFSFYTVLYYCWGWLIEERVDEFVIEKYIEISKGTSIISIMYKFMLIRILNLLVLQYNRIDRQHVHIYICRRWKNTGTFPSELWEDP